MRRLAIAVFLALAGTAALPASAQVSFGFSSGPVQLGINIPVYPRLVPIPGYPVYYAPNLNQDYFFYDGLYWLFYDDTWYQSEWYNGPWTPVPPDAVPLYILRVPVRYYAYRPYYFRGWALNEPPRWHEHWGRDWAEHHRDWDRWDHRAAPAPAPLPDYQRRYSQNGYPNYREQHAQNQRYYGYQPRDNEVRRQWDQHAQSSAELARRREHLGRQAPGLQPGTPAHGPTQRDAERLGSGG